MSFRKWRYLISLALLWVATAAPAEELPTVPVEQKTIPKQYQFDGVVEAVNRATVSSRIAAEVIEVNFDVNDRVEKDAVILRFRDDEIETRLMRAEANLLAEKSQYQEALARRKEARAEAGRIADLFARKQVPRSALDKAEADKAAAEARVNVLAAQIKAREAEVEEAKVTLSYTVVRAPYAGIVTRRWIEVGEMASPGQLLMSGVSFESLRVVTQIPQRLLNQLLPAAVIDISTVDGTVLEAGEVTLIPQADASSHAFDLRIQLTGAVDTVYPGSSVKVRLRGAPETLLLIPDEAIVQRSEATGVYVLKESGIQFRQVRSGRKLESGEREILAGLEAGERVVTDPTLALRMLKSNQETGTE
ncbi:MAG: efflux RND transporter periplasmic adaptor subunit [Methylophaga sp.]|jgi:RND family efflux transporter MFP subunit